MVNSFNWTTAEHIFLSAPFRICGSLVNFLYTSWDLHFTIPGLGLIPSPSSFQFCLHSPYNNLFGSPTIQEMTHESCLEWMDQVELSIVSVICLLVPEYVSTCRVSMNTIRKHPKCFPLERWCSEYEIVRLQETFHCDLCKFLLNCYPSSFTCVKNSSLIRTTT